MEKLLRATLIVSLTALVLLTPLWLLSGGAAQLIPAAAADRTAPTAGPTPTPSPEPTPDPAVLRAERYDKARAALRGGRHEEALPLLAELGDYRDAADLADGCRAVLYDRATEHLYARELEQAQPLLQLLGDYRDSLRWLRYCMRWTQADPITAPLIRPEHLIFTPKHGRGSVYGTRDAVIYVPKNCDRNTALVVYYSGGSDLNKTLSENAAYNYAATYGPNALCYFCRISGFYNMSAYNQELWGTIEQLMRECSLVPHDIYLVGTSNGFYTTMAMAVKLLQEEDLPVRALASWDAGENWKIPDRLLSAGELSALAAEGTRFELFEQRKFNAERKVIQDMVDAGLAVDLIECSNGDHEKITENAFRYGVISWLIGERKLNEKEYALTRLGS